MKIISLISIATLFTGVFAKRKLADWYDDVYERYEKTNAPAGCIAEWDALMHEFGAPELEEKGGADSYFAIYQNQFIGKYYCVKMCKETCPDDEGYTKIKITPQIGLKDSPSDGEVDCKCVQKKAKNCKDKNTPFDQVQTYYEEECLGWVNGEPVAATTPVADTAAPPAIEDTVDDEFICDASTQRPVFLVSQHHTYNTIAAQLIDLDDKSEHECLDMCREQDPTTSSTPCYTAMYERTTRRCHLYGSNVKNIQNGNGETITGLQIGNQHVMYERHCVTIELAEAAVCNDGIIHKLPGYAHVVDPDDEKMVFGYTDIQSLETMGACIDLCYTFDPQDACPCSFVTWDISTTECRLYAAGRLMTVDAVKNDAELQADLGKFDSAMLPTCTLAHKGYDYGNISGQ